MLGPLAAESLHLYGVVENIFVYHFDTGYSKTHRMAMAILPHVHPTSAREMPDQVRSPHMHSLTNLISAG